MQRVGRRIEVAVSVIDGTMLMIMNGICPYCWGVLRWVEVNRAVCMNCGREYEIVFRGG